MAILSGDIKLVASQVMDDVDEGGGAPTSTVITDGTSNSIFPDISELDRAGGRVNLRKVFPHVQTNNRDTYLGANIILADPPDDPNVSVTIFKSSDTFDRRSDAADRIEAYLNRSTVWDGFLFENHIAGQRAIQIFHRPGVAAPPIGKTLCLVANEGLVNEYFQYIRVIDVSTVVRTFSYQSAVNANIVEYQAAVSTCSISDALTSDYTGSPATPFFTAAVGKSILRDTIVADAAKYCGASPVSNPVSIGAYKASVQSIFSKIVPSAQSETALVDQPLVGSALPMVATAPDVLTRNVIAAGAVPFRHYLPTGCMPGTLSLDIGAFGVVTDDGKGGVLRNGTPVGTIDYAVGAVVAPDGIGFTGGAFCDERYRPGAAVLMQGYTVKREVTAENRAYVWVIPCVPTPAPLSVSVSYMAQGNWYELRDDGTGALRGTDAAYGAGTVSYVTGTVSVTLGALPDVDSDVILSWGTPQEYVLLANTDLKVEAPTLEFDLGQAVQPGTVNITWPTGQSATDNGNGAITGGATGEIYYGTGKGWLRFTNLPTASSISIAFDAGGSEQVGTTTGGGNSWNTTLPNAPIKAKSLVIEFGLLQQLVNPDEYGRVAESSQIVQGLVRDNGSGGLTLDGHGPLIGSSINYTTGAVVMPVNIAATFPVAQYQLVNTRADSL